MTKKIGIFGTSGFAREVADIAYELDHTVVFIARSESDASLITDESLVVLESEIDRVNIDCFAIGIGDNKSRQKIAQKFKNQKNFINLIHPTASFGRNQRERVHQKSGVIICAGVRFTNNIHVGDFCIFNLNATIGHDAIIDDFVNIAPGASISGQVHIEPFSWIGTGAVINQGTSDNPLIIGQGATVGSGAAVIQNCEPDGVYVGIPAKRVK